MDVVIIIIGALCVLAGLVGCVLPVLPGPPLCWAGYFVLKFTDIAGAEITWTKVIILGLLAVIVAIVDNLLPVVFTKKKGATRMVTVGAAAGLIIGLFFGVAGIFIGPFAGAFIGALLDGHQSDAALRMAFNTFWGFSLGLILKLVLSGYMVVSFISALS